MRLTGTIVTDNKHTLENKEEHLKNMRRLFTILSNEELIEALKGAESPKELLALEEKFLFPQ